jgi:hypothetical protein
MVQRVLKATLSGWRPWAIGAVVSMGCAAFWFMRRQQRALHATLDYEAWWQRREKARANGHRPPPHRDRTDSSQLFV